MSAVGQTEVVRRARNGNGNGNAITANVHGELSKVGWTPPPELTFEDWNTCIAAVTNAGRAVQWWLGDMLSYGEAKYGEKYTKAVEATGYDEGTLANTVWVSKRIETSRRREVLSWAHHVEVAPLPPADQDHWLEQAEQNQWTRNELRKAIKALTPEPVKEYPAGTYRVIYADPPWKYNDQRTGTKEAGAAVAHYPVMELEQICQMRDECGKHVSDLARDNCVCFLWATSPLLPEGLKVLEAWGFEYKASFVWDKSRGYNGHYNDVRHEILLIGVRGSCVPDTETLQSSIQAFEKTRHSKKPAQFYELIESMYTSGPYVELFARNERYGWDSWGNQV